MKFRIKLGSNSCDGSDIYRIYRVEGEMEMYMDSAMTIEIARDKVARLLSPKPEVVVEEHAS